MLIAPAPALIGIAGFCVFAFVKHEKVVELGRALMWSGVFVTILSMAGKTAHLF